MPMALIVQALDAPLPEQGFLDKFRGGFLPCEFFRIIKKLRSFLSLQAWLLVLGPTTNNVDENRRFESKYCA